MTKKSSSSAKLPSVYAVTGSIQPSDFAFYQSHSDDIDEVFASAKSLKDIYSKVAPVAVRTHQGFVGTISNYLEKEAFEKAISDGKNSPKSTNLGKRDIATLAPEMDTACVMGSIKFVNNFAKPNISDVNEFTDVHKEFVQKYSEKYGLAYIIEQYLANIANAKILWRNQYGIISNIFIRIRATGKEPVIFVNQKDWQKKAADIVAAALEQNKTVLMDVAISVIVGDGAEVYPSQPFCDSKKSMRGDDDYGRIISTVKRADGIEQVILHSQKIANALRCIDTWYSDESDVEPIAVEVYGAVTTQREVNREKGNNSFFDYFNYELNSRIDDEKVAHYVMAMLIKGGVLGFGKSKES